MPYLLLFILLPALELALLIEVGGLLGTIPTLLLILTTGVVGAALARRQGLSVLKDIQNQTAQGTLPAQALIDGVIILVAGALLVTPGILTDVVGFLCLVPVTRRGLQVYLKHRFERAIVTSGGRGVHPSDPSYAPPGPVIDIKVESEDQTPNPR